MVHATAAPLVCCVGYVRRAAASHAQVRLNAGQRRYLRKQRHSKGGEGGDGGDGGEGGVGGEGGEGGEGGALPPRRSEAAQGLLAHAEWYERALHNGVLGTQRGVQPGAMVSTLVGSMHTIGVHAHHRCTSCAW